MNNHLDRRTVTPLRADTRVADARPMRAHVDLELTGFSRRVGLERTTFSVDMMSPILAALRSDEHLAFTIGAGPSARPLRISVDATLCASTATALAERTADMQRLLHNILRVQLPGFRFRVRIVDAGPGHHRSIRPAGRPLAVDRSGERSLGPQPLPADDLQQLLLPPAGLAPERVMAAAQIVASMAGAMKLSIGLRLVPIDARLRRAVEEALTATEDQSAQTHLEAVRRLATAAPDHAHLSALACERSAVEVSVTASADTPIDDTTAEMLSYALFGAPLAEAFDHNPAFDLSNIYPAGLALPTLVTGVALSAAYSFQRPQRDYAATSDAGMRLGRTHDGDEVVISEKDRQLHVFAIGATGTGKSTLLLNQLTADMETGKGLILVDPHGDLWEAALAAVPARRRRDLVVGHLGDPARSFSLNVLEGLGGDPAIERAATVNGLLRLFTRTFWSGVPEAFGPIFEMYFRNAMLLLMEGQGEKASILDFERVFQDDAFREELLNRCASEPVRDFWRKTVAEMTYRDWSLENMNPYITSKLSPFIANPLVRPVLGGTRSSLDLPAAIASGKIVLLNLAKGTVGEGSARLIGSLVTMRLVAAAQTQMRIPPARRKAFVAYLDEFQTYATEHIAEAIEETRKYRLSLVLACQSLGQIDGRHHRSDVGRSIIANVANLISFRLGVEDAQTLARWFEPDVSADELMYLPNYQAVARLLVDGEALRPVEFRARPPGNAVDPGQLGPILADAS